MYTREKGLYVFRSNEYVYRFKEIGLLYTLGSKDVATIIHMHGDLSHVRKEQKRVEEVLKSLGMQDIMSNLEILAGPIEVDDLNSILTTEGYLTEYVRKKSIAGRKNKNPKPKQ